MKVKNKKFKILVLTLFLIMLLSSSLTAYATDKYSYSLDIPKVQGLTHTTYTLYRGTNNVENKCGVKLTYSNEHTKDHPDGSANTATTFWLGVDNPDGVNPTGSAKVNVNENAISYTKSNAYSRASLKNVYLYARDNAAKNAAYDIDGYWYATLHN